MWERRNQAAKDGRQTWKKNMGRMHEGWWIYSFQRKRTKSKSKSPTIRGSKKKKPE